MPRDEVRLRHMLDATNKAIAFTRSRTRADLDADEQLQLAVVRLIEIIGEAAKHISEETQRRAPSVPWAQIAGTRDRLIHGYFDVNLDVVWTIVTNDLPPLQHSLNLLLGPSA